ncbi:hypothetical protein [Clostridium sp. BNL1100]|uniref:hypothetical protein n=1 Tax=Clostridium sp. BNL1100 TaxID=755731 RepID=UPI00024A76CB|nr:hypothetical protein [Clostridium sp. BNL1100]AEY65606.1 hypothetical protein Clo1100_1370 [Clostridium sp. BNL1100]
MKKIDKRMHKDNKSEEIDIKSLFSHTSDDSNQGYYVVNGNTNGALVKFEHGSIRIEIRVLFSWNSMRRGGG